MNIKSLVIIVLITLPNHTVIESRDSLVHRRQPREESIGIIGSLQLTAKKVIAGISNGMIGLATGSLLGYGTKGLMEMFTHKDNSSTVQNLLPSTTTVFSVVAAAFLAKGVEAQSRMTKWISNSFDNQSDRDIIEACGTAGSWAGYFLPLLIKSPTEALEFILPQKPNDTLKQEQEIDHKLTP